MKPEQSVYNKLHKFSAKEEPMEINLTAISELKDFAMEAANASMKAGNGLNDVIKGLAAAKTIANKGLSASRRAIAVAKDLGLDTSEFEKHEKLFSRWYDDYENSISLVQNLQNRL